MSGWSETSARSIVFRKSSELTKLAGALKITPCQDQNDLIRVIRTAEEISSFGTAGLSGAAMFIEHWLPRGKVLHLVSDDEIRPGKFLLWFVLPTRTSLIQDNSASEHTPKKEILIGRRVCKAFGESVDCCRLDIMPSEG
jgi:hypothetical protein